MPIYNIELLSNISRVCSDLRKYGINGKSVYYGKLKIDHVRIKKAGYDIYGGVNVPYIWLKTPNGMDLRAFFDEML